MFEPNKFGGVGKKKAQPSSLDVLVLVGEVRVRAGLHTIHKLLHKASCCT